MAASGAKNRASRKQPPVTTEARPVLAPAATPAADSTYVVADDAPAAPPATAARESTSRTRLSRGSLPSAVSQPASPAIPMTSPPLIPRACSQSVKRMPNTATATGGVVSSPSVTGTPGGPGLTMPAETSPMNRMNSPMPTPMARFNARGERERVVGGEPHGDGQDARDETCRRLSGREGRTLARERGDAGEGQDG